MTSLYRLQANTARTRHYVSFSSGLQNKLDDLIWARPDHRVIDPRWKITGTAQEDLSDRLLQQLDYVPAISALDIFSRRFVELQPAELATDVDFIACTVVSKTGREHPFYLARCHRFVEIIDYEATIAAERDNILAPIIFRRVTPFFLMVRDSHRRTISVVSEQFKHHCEHHHLKIGFYPIKSAHTARSQTDPTPLR